MLYLGFTMRYETAEAFLGSTPEKVLTGTVQMQDLDKGVKVLGIALTSISGKNIWGHDSTLTESLLRIHQAKMDFDSEMKRLGVNLHNVQMDYVESESKIHDWAEPVLIEWD